MKTKKQVEEKLEQYKSSLFYNITESNDKINFERIRSFRLALEWVLEE